jgi:hypothetical protein
VGFFTAAIAGIARFASRGRYSEGDAAPEFLRRKLPGLLIGVLAFLLIMPGVLYGIMIHRQGARQEAAVVALKQHEELEARMRAESQARAERYREARNGEIVRTISGLSDPDRARRLATLSGLATYAAGGPQSELALIPPKEKARLMGLLQERRKDLITTGQNFADYIAIYGAIDGAAARALSEEWSENAVDYVDPHSEDAHQIVERLVRDGKVEAIKRILERGYDPLAQNRFHRDSLFELAVEQEKPELLNAVLAKGVPPDTPVFGRGSALVQQCARYDPRIDIIRALLAGGANPNQRTAAGEPCLHNAIVHDQVKVALALLESKADPDALDPDGCTALEIAETRSSGARQTLLATLARYHAHRAAELPTSGKPAVQH